MNLLQVTKNVVLSFRKLVLRNQALTSFSRLRLSREKGGVAGSLLIPNFSSYKSSSYL